MEAGLCYDLIIWKPTSILPMPPDQRRILEARVNAKKAASRVVLRSIIFLSATDGQSNNAISKELGISRPTIILRRTRLKNLGSAGVCEDVSHGRSFRRLGCCNRENDH